MQNKIEEAFFSQDEKHYRTHNFTYKSSRQIQKQLSGPKEKRDRIDGERGIGVQHTSTIWG